MTKQELLNTSVAHVLAQGSPSVNGTGCMYRSPDGKQCAAGPFIVSYDEDMENKNWEHISEIFGDSLNPDAVKEADFVRELQFAHDNAAVEVKYTAPYKCENIVRDDASFLEVYKLNIRELVIRHQLVLTAGINA